MIPLYCEIIGHAQTVMWMTKRQPQLCNLQSAIQLFKQETTTPIAYKLIEKSHAKLVHNFFFFNEASDSLGDNN